MKAFWKRFFLCLCLLLCLSLAAFAEEAEEEAELVTERPWLDEMKPEILPSDVWASLPTSGNAVEIRATEIDGEIWLFLPAFADAETMTLSQDGETLTWEETGEEDGVRTGDLMKDGETVGEMYVMQSENLRALFLISDDPENAGREFVEVITTKATRNEATGSMAIVSAEGVMDHAGALRQIRVRGNLTGGLDKRAYQIKLENRVDLLKTGNPAERNRTWVLLADHLDKTMLHNRIALDMAQEIGLTDSSLCEHVDVYYDGEYRGLYLLAEKVEVNEGRIDVDDYTEMVEMWNESAGQTNLDALEVKYSKSEYGEYYAYLDGLVEVDDPSVGTYLVEMEHETNTLNDSCWFRLSNQSVLSMKSPKYASKAMVCYVRDRLEEARQCLVNGGTHPETGLTMEDYFDVDAFARILLLHEALSNVDGYGYSSSWFVLPAGEIRFEPGPAWDFDLTMREFRSGSNKGGKNLKNNGDWPGLFYGVPRFMEHIQTLWAQEMYPLIRDVLLGGQEGTVLRPLESYVEEIEASYRMNDKIWDHEEYSAYVYGDTWEKDIELMRKFLTGRCAWMEDVFMNVSNDEETIYLSGNAQYTKLEEEMLFLNIAPWSHGSIKWTSLEMVEEATEEDYAVWQLEAVITPDEGHSFENPEIRFDDTVINYEKQDDGTLKIAFTFEDLSYRPVDYYGEDIGMFYNPDVYAENYPEIAEMYEDDPEGLMNHFCDEGMYEDQKGNAFFRPSEVLYTFPNLYDLLGTDWSTYYWDYVYYGASDGWMRRLSYGYPLTVLEDLM